MDRQEDVLVIGGGIIGVCSAYYLLESGRSVTLLERDDICSGSSYGNGGLVVPSSVPLAAPGAVAQGLKWMLSPESPFYIKPRLDPGLLSWLWRFRAAANQRKLRSSLAVASQFGSASLALFEDLVSREALDCGFTRKGTLSLYRTERGLKEGLAEAEIQEESGASSVGLSASEVMEMEPILRPGVVGGVFHRDDAHLKPDDFVLELASRVRDRGGSIETGVEVVGFETRGRNVEAVRTTRGEFPCRQVVLAAGAWSPGVARDLGLRLPVQPAKGYSVTFHSPERLPQVPLKLGEARIGATPIRSALRLAGTLELSGINLEIRERRVRAILQGARQYLALDLDSGPREVWCGLRPLSPDGLPVIGRVSSPANVILATGHSMTGVTLGPATGKLVAQLANEETPLVEPSPFSPERFL